MNELLQKHGCANVFTVPEGLRELMSDITREVLRDQPPKIFDYIANYLSVLLITREHGILAVRILEDLCDCKRSVSEQLVQLGVGKDESQTLSQIIKEEVESVEPIEGKEKVKETQIMQKILAKTVLDEDMTAKVCQITRNAYRDYWYKKKLMEKSLNIQPKETWEIAAERTLQLYKRTKPSFNELTRATEKIQAAYRGYYIRRNLLRHLKPKSKKTSGPKVDLPGPPQDIAASREIDLGPVIDVKVREDDVGALFDDAVGEKLGLQYDPMRTITHLKNEQEFPEEQKVLVEAQKEEKSRSSMLKTGSRHARMSSQLEGPIEIHHPIMTMEERSSRTPSQVPTASELHKISFSEMPPEIIVDTEETQEVEDELAVESDHEAAEAVHTETAQEVPEDIPDRSEGDGESVPTASIPSSATDTANTTDVEDIGEDIDTAEEGGEDLLDCMSSNCVSINTLRKMEDLLQSQIKKSCNLAIPNGLKELMWDISREVLRSQPQDVYNFITKYLSVMLVTRENLTVAAQVCDETCHAPCQRALEDKLRDIGLKDEDFDKAKEIIMEHLKGAVKESNLLLKLMRKTNIVETMLPAVLEAIRSAFVQHNVHKAVVFEAKPEDEVIEAVNHTLRLYENTSPTNEEYNRMARKIQAAYRAYGVRRALCVKRNENRQKYSEIKVKTLKIKDYVHVGIKEPEITKSPQSNIRASITTNLSTSLAGSYIKLTKYTPYSAHDIHAHNYEEVFEKEHYNADFIEDIKYDEQVSIHGDKKKDGNRRISFETLTIEDSFVADNESESSIEEFIHAEDDDDMSETSESNEEIAEICDIDEMENINEVIAMTKNTDEKLNVI